MAISNVASGLRPGVCTSTTRPSAPYTGQIIYETDTGYLRVWDGSAWDYLSQKQDDTVGLGPVGGLVYITGVSIGSAVSSVTISTAFSSTYDQYLITVSGGTATTSDLMSLQLGSTTTGYYEARPGVTLSTGAFLGNVTSNGSVFYTGQYTTTGKAMHTVLINPNLPTETRHFSQGYNTNTVACSLSTGMLNNTTQYSGFIITPLSGTWTGGVVSVYGYRKA